MQINPRAVAQQMQRKPVPLYVLIGQDTYLLEEAFTHIKASLKSATDCEEQVLSVQAAEDWKSLVEAANSYSLFSSTTLLNVVFDKKTLDAAGKKVLTEYLNAPNPHCFIILRAPNLPAKQIAWLTNHQQVVAVVAYPLSSAEMKSWIVMQLKKHAFTFSPDIPELIHQYTQGNMLATAQCIEKISLSNAANTQITAQHVLDHASNQCEHSLYDLVDACLLGQGDKAVQILRQAANNKTEATLVLWMLTQEVRLLSQLLFLLNQKIDLKTACGQLKIWPQKASMYHMSSKRTNARTLHNLLHYCKTIDEQIKSNLNHQVWNAFECVALSLCLGRFIGDACTL